MKTHSTVFSPFLILSPDLCYAQSLIWFDDAPVIDQRTVLLGFFRLNLAKALEESTGANSSINAVLARHVVKFFVFGKTNSLNAISCN
jgi:hypothetical protein